jgi:hypothetical protein
MTDVAEPVATSQVPASPSSPPSPSPELVPEENGRRDSPADQGLLVLVVVGLVLAVIAIIVAAIIWARRLRKDEDVNLGTNALSCGNLEVKNSANFSSDASGESLMLLNSPFLWTSMGATKLVISSSAQRFAITPDVFVQQNGGAAGIWTWVPPSGDVPPPGIAPNIGYWQGPAGRQRAECGLQWLSNSTTPTTTGAWQIQIQWSAQQQNGEWITGFYNIQLPWTGAGGWLSIMTEFILVAAGYIQFTIWQTSGTDIECQNGYSKLMVVPP